MKCKLLPDREVAHWLSNILLILGMNPLYLRPSEVPKLTIAVHDLNYLMRSLVYTVQRKQTLHKCEMV